MLAASLVPAILFAGGVGAFVKTYRVLEGRRRLWSAWQGAGWFLLTLMLMTLAIPGAALDYRLAASMSRSSRLRILPVGLRGSSSRKITSRGTL